MPPKKATNSTEKAACKRKRVDTADISKPNCTDSDSGDNTTPSPPSKKFKAAPETPIKHNAPATDASAKKRSPKKPAVALRLPSVTNAPNQIAVTYESSLSSLNNFVHSIKLSAENTFKLVGTYTAVDGEFAGKQLIVIEPAKPFSFLKLQPEIRKLVYIIYFASKNVRGASIAFDGKRKGTGDLYAKTYAVGSKNRVALLATSRQIYQEALPVLYETPIKIAAPSDILNILTLFQPEMHERLRQIRIDSWPKGSGAAKAAMYFLATADCLDTLFIATGVATDGDIIKAARNFWNDAGRLLTAIGSKRAAKQTDTTAATQARLSAVDILQFGKNALTKKVNGETGVAWTRDEKNEFKNELRKRLMRAYAKPTCDCSSTVVGHSCAEEIAVQREAHQRLETWSKLLKGHATTLRERRGLKSSSY